MDIIFIKGKTELHQIINYLQINTSPPVLTENNNIIYRY